MFTANFNNGSVKDCEYSDISTIIQMYLMLGGGEGLNINGTEISDKKVKLLLANSK